MNKVETMAVMATLNAAFPAFYKGQPKTDAEAAVNLWSEMFRDDPAESVMAAVKVYIATCTSGYPPTIGAIKEALQDIRASDRPPESDAWALASQAAAGNLPWEKLPKEVQQVIGSKNVLISWGMTDVETFNTVIYSNFIKAYKTCEVRAKSDAMIPQHIKGVIQELSDGMSINAKALPEGK